MQERKNAKVTLELSLMIGILVVIVIAALMMFCNGLRDVVANSGFTKHALNKEELADKTDFTAIQDTIEVAGVQGVFQTYEDAREWSKSTIQNVLNKETPTPEDLEKLAKSIAITELTSGTKERISVNGKDMELTDAGKMVLSEKYGNISIMFSRDCTLQVNNKKLEIKNLFAFSSNNNTERANAIYKAKFK